MKTVPFTFTEDFTIYFHSENLPCTITLWRFTFYIHFENLPFTFTLRIYLLLSLWSLTFYFHSEILTGFVVSTLKLPLFFIRWRQWIFFILGKKESFTLSNHIKLKCCIKHNNFQSPLLLNVQCICWNMILSSFLLFTFMDNYTATVFHQLLRFYQHLWASKFIN